MSRVDITTAIGTASAAVVALGLGLRGEWRAIRTEQRQQERERAAQASLVTGWMSSLIIQGDPYPEIRIRARNGNETPVYQVSLKVNVGVRGTFIRYIDAMGPNETREFRIWLPGYPRTNILTPDLTFMDSAGRRWLRQGSGELRELGEYEDIQFKEDAGAYDSINKHPTLHLPEDEFRTGGRIVT